MFSNRLTNATLFISVTWPNTIKNHEEICLNKGLQEASTPYKLTKSDLSKKDVYLPSELVDLGTAATQKLKAVGESKDQKIKLQKTCSSMLKAIVEKMQEKSPKCEKS